MTRRPIVAALLLVAWAAAAAATQNQANQFDGVVLTPTRAAGNVYMIQRPGGGGNVGALVGPEGVLLVDSLFAPLADRLVAAVRQVTDREIRFLINTHIHPDHIGGNEPLASRGVLIFAHDNVRLRTFEPLRFPRQGGQFVARPADKARPVITYNDTITFFLNGEEVRAFLVPPAHTDGDSFVHFPQSNVLHLGDAFRTTSYPIVDVYNGGTVDGTIKALDMAIALAGPDTRIIPGHGLAVVGRETLVEFRDMVVDIRASVLSMIKAGRSLDDVLAAKVTGKYDARWDHDPTWKADDFIPIVYFELGGSARRPR